MTLTVASDGVTLERPTRRYVEKTVMSLEKFLPREQRSGASAKVALRRVDRAHGNKYEVTVTLSFGGRFVTATDSTLNALAALDIVHAKIRAELAD